MSDHIDLNAAADPQTLAPPKRGRGRPRKNPPPEISPPPPPPPPPRPALSADGAAAGVVAFAPKDMVWGQKLAHPSWPGEVLSVADNGTQLLVSFFGDRALAWCDASQLRPYEPYFPLGELYDGEAADDFDAAVDASLEEFSRRIQASLTAPANSPDSVTRPFIPRYFLHSLQDLAVDRTGFTNRVQAAIAMAHLRAFDSFRGLPDPPRFTVEIGIANAHVLPAPSTIHGDRGRGRGRKGVREEGNSGSVTPPRRGRRKEEAQEVDSDEDWDPRKKGAVDSDTDVDMELKRSNRGRGRGRGKGFGTPRGRPRGRPRKIDSARAAWVLDEMEVELEYPPAAEMLLQLMSIAADPFNFKGYDSVKVLFSFFLKHKDSETPNPDDDKELLETFGGKKGRKKSLEIFTKAEHDIDEHEQHLDTADGQRGRRKSAGSIYSARKAEDSYWCDIIISDFDDGDTSSDYEARKRKRLSQNQSVNEMTNQEVAPQDGFSTDLPEEKLGDGPAALILHFINSEAIPSADYINSIFRTHGPIVEGETEINKESKIAKVIFSRSADAEQAYCNLGKFNVFGPALLTYELKYLSLAPQVP